MIAFYNGVSGMIAYQENLNVTAQNIANVNTIGYKASRSSFNDLLYTQMNTKVEGENLVGHGVKHQDTDLMFQQGSFQSTENMYDFALASDNGLFAVENANGEIEYTRNGTFALSTSGNSMYLVTSDGAFVLDARGANIKVPVKEGTTNVPDLEGLNEKIGVYTFSNPYGLENRQGSRFVETALSGEPVAMKTTDGVIMQGMLEFSKTDLAQEMTKMIEAQRAFQLNAKVVQTADELESTVNNLR